MAAPAADPHTGEGPPEAAQRWLAQGLGHARRNAWRIAAGCLRRAVRLDPASAAAWHALGIARERNGRLPGAFSALRQALLLDPTRGGTYLALGELLDALGQSGDAAGCLERALRHGADPVRSRRRLARLRREEGDPAAAAALAEAALAAAPGDTGARLELAQALEDLGDPEAARAAYAMVARACPGHGFALGRLAALPGPAGEDPHTAAARRLLENTQAAREARALAGYGLARRLDRAGDPAGAARAGRAANAARRSYCGGLDRARLRRRLDGLTTTYDADFFAARRRYGIGTAQPVFIVGLPRSGTTLVEQMLAAHPRLHGAGELPDLARLAAERAASSDAPPWRSAGLLAEAESRIMAHAYLDRLRRHALRRAARISDKSPLNFFHLALVALLFPAARIIHCRRDLRDTALSIWLENFAPSQRYATDFGDIAAFAAAERRLMAHWRTVLPLPVLEVRYEDSVADPERQARRVLAFLEVPWDPRCLDFHRARRAVQTPSRWQVRRPIYLDALGRWRRYEAHLPQLLQAFPSAASEQSL